MYLKPSFSTMFFSVSQRQLHFFSEQNSIFQCSFKDRVLRLVRVFPSSLLILLPFLFHTPCFYRVFNMDCNVDGYLLWRCGGNLFSGTRNISPLFFFSDLCVCRSFFHVFSLLFYSCCAFFYPFLNTSAQRHHHCH